MSNAAGCAHSAKHVRGGLIQEAMLLEADERALRRRARVRGGFRPPGPRGGAGGFSPRSRSRSVCSGSKVSSGDLALGFASETRSLASRRQSCRTGCGGRASPRRVTTSRASNEQKEEGIAKHAEGSLKRSDGPIGPKRTLSAKTGANLSPRLASHRKARTVSAPIGESAFGQGSRHAKGASRPR